MEFLHESFKLDFWMANQSCCVTLAGSLAFHSSISMKDFRTVKSSCRAAWLHHKSYLYAGLLLRLQLCLALPLPAPWHG